MDHLRGFRGLVRAAGRQQRPAWATGARLGTWTVTPGDINLIDTARWPAADGDQSLDLSGDTGAAGAVTVRRLLIP